MWIHYLTKPVGIKKAWKQSSVAFYCAPIEGPLPLGKKEEKSICSFLEKANPNSLPLEKFLQKTVVWRLFQQSGKPQERMYKEC